MTKHLPYTSSLAPFYSYNSLQPVHYIFADPDGDEVNWHVAVIDVV